MNSFFNSTNFAVVGASNNRSKFGNIVLRWYQDRDISVQPINPTETIIEGLPVLASLNLLTTSPSSTSISVITPPSITLNILKQAKSIGIKNIWLQPGCENQEVIEWIEKEDVENKIIYGGDCILVLGDRLLNEKKEKEKNGKM